MNKNIIKMVFAIILMLVIVGCGQGATTEVTQNAAASLDEKEEINISDDISEIKKEIEVVSTVQIIYPDDIVIDTSSNADRSFYTTVNGGGKVVYFGHDRDMSVYVKKSWEGQKVTYTTEDPLTVIVDESGIAKALKEGCTNIVLSNENGDVQKISVIATTFNDMLSVRGDQKATNQSFYYDPGNVESANLISFDGEWVKQNINTMADLLYFINVNNIIYDIETPIPVDINSCWNWGNSGETIINTKHGVCADIANVAAFALQYDYEDLGFVEIFGKSGHIFNYVYENGYYFLVDYTKAISANEANQPLEDINKLMWRFKTIDEIKDFVMDKYWVEDSTIAIIMYSAQNHDYQPAQMLSYCHDSYFNMNSPLVIGFEESVYNQMTILYWNGNANMNINSYPISSIPQGVPTYEKRLRTTKYDYGF